MKVKHFQEVADMEGVLKKVQEHKEKKDEGVLKHWAYNGMTKEEIDTQKEVFRYLKNLQHGKVMWDKQMVIKPTQEDAIKAFERYQKHLESVHGVNKDNFEEKKKNVLYKIAAKEFECTKHYIFQFTLDGWYEKLPNEQEVYVPKF